MMEAANWIVEYIDRIGTFGCLAFAVWYFSNKMSKLEAKHDREFLEMRKEHREEREATQRHTNAALDKIAIEIAAANKERQDIKILLQSVTKFNNNVEHALHDYDRVLNQIAAKLDVGSALGSNDYLYDNRARSKGMVRYPPNSSAIRQTNLTNWAEGE